MGTDIKQVEPNQSNMMAILSSAVNKGDKEMLETIAKLYREERDDARRIAYNDAMALAQSEMRKITPNASNPMTKSQYATYDAMDEVLRPIYTKHGFSIEYNTKPSEDPRLMHAVCRLSHREGWYQDFNIDMPADGKGARGNDVMTATHATMSAISYAMRALLKMMFNVPIGFDDDGNAAGKRKRQEPPTKMEPPQGVDIQGMKSQIWDYCLAESDGDDTRAQAKLYEITTGWKTVNGKREKHFEGVTDVNDQDFNDKRAQFVHSQIYRTGK